MNNEIADIEHKLKVANAQISTESVLNAALTIKAYNGGNADITTLVETLRKQVDKVVDGDTRRIETMLMTQAQALDVIFHKMIKTSMNAQSLSHLQVYADLGFKAQNQCRKVLLTLTEIKNPKRATFIKQQNNAISQQVNNSIESENLKKTKNITNELMEVEYERVDARTTIAPVSVNPAMETVEMGRS